MSLYPLLNSIDSPTDLKKLSDEQIVVLADEIRGFLIENVEKSGGHLASNLGVVELTLAIHKVFDAPKDHIIFDVGHQAYVHKLITGRREAFSTLRTPGGLSGFTQRQESVYDAFGAGHSSTSLSASLGFSEADKLTSKDAFSVCVIGDGAYTGGMIHEALNNCKPSLPMVIVLNENGMSISNNKGAFASYLSRVRVSHRYRELKKSTSNFLSKIPFIGDKLKSFAASLKSAVKKMIYIPNYFEELGLYYIGPIDGNDFCKTKDALLLAKSLGKSVVVHLQTKKGKGYAPAEESPVGYHSIGNNIGVETFNSIFSDKLITIADINPSVVAITAAMGIGTGLSKFGEKFSDRYFDVGIAEGHALTFSAGLCAAGLKPFVAIYSTFLQRGYDSLLHDIALQNLPVTLMIDRAGLSLADGATHHGIFDVSFISHIPNFTLLHPISYDSLNKMVDYATICTTPIAIRYSNSSENSELLNRFYSISDDCLSRVLLNFDKDNPPENIFITYGKIYERVFVAQELLEKKGKKSGIIIVETIKPYKPVCLLISPILSKAKRVVYVEEGIKSGGAGENTLMELINNDFDISKTKFKVLAIDDNFASPRETCDLYDYVGLSAKCIAEEVLREELKIDL